MFIKESAMKQRYVQICLGVLLFMGTSWHTAMAGDMSFGYGKEFRGNDNIEQFEVAYREKLPYSWGGGESLEVLTGVEGAAAYVREDGGNSDAAMRFSAMPILLIGPENSIGHLVLGFGAGLMAGETEFTDHNLGGPFFFASKVGLRLVFADRVMVEYDFYHQSNAGIYDYNAGLTMNMLSVGLLF